MPRPRVVFLVNGEAQTAMGIRARSLAERLASAFEIDIVYRAPNKIYAVMLFLRELARIRPKLSYVLDMSFSGVLAAGFYRMLTRCLMVVDSGDAIYELSRNSGNRSPLGLWLTKLLEWFALSVSDRMVVRSHPYQELLAKDGIASDVIPDGVDMQQFSPADDRDFRQEHNLEGFTVVGLVGSLIWNSKWQMCYGWELIEVVDRLRDRPVKGLIIGDGSGLSWLKAQCSARGLDDRIVFAGRIPYDDLPHYLNLMDICLSTQSNDVAGQVRTTGKLPLYLACGRFILSTEVGEAARVLPREMLVPYKGTKDSEYPARLTERVKSLLDQPECLGRRGVSVEISRTHFDYDTLAARLGRTLFEVISPGRRDLRFPAAAELPAVVEPPASRQPVSKGSNS